GVYFAAGIASGDSMGLSDTIVADNYSFGIVASDVSTSSGSAVSGSGNLILFSFVPVPPDTVELNPLLGPLADNGGPTQTHAIGFDSPAFDAGADDVGPVPYAYDQRGEGYPRVVGGNPDIGAFEFQSTPAELVIAPDLLDFGSVGVGTVSGPMDVTLSNAGSGDLHVSAIDSAFVPFGGVGGSCGAPPFTLTPAAFCTVTYTFAPIATGAASQNIFVMSDGGNGAFTLQGTGVGGTLSVVPDTLEFGAVGVGTISAPMSVTLGNSGAGTLEVDAIDAAGAPFAAAGGTCGAPPFDLGPAASCTLAYTFAPTDPGDASQTLDVTSDGGDGAFTLHGTGVTGTLSIAPTTLDFGSVAVGDTAPAQSVTLSNSGAGTLEVDAIDAAGAPFAATGGTCGSPPFDLAPAASCTFAYTFAPTDPGDASQTLDVTSDGGDGAFTLEGTGVQGTLGISPTTLDFGQVAVGDTTAAQSVTVSNLGTADVHVGAIDPASAPFAEAGGTCGEPPFTLAPAAVCTLDYVFAPGVVGAAFQTFEVTSDAGEGQFTLTGEGIPAEPQDRIFANGFDP
ncbi:MAG TPA: choice-of-anchor D domain-containing protein, partial [Rhodanobacteraceae bacterium]|nr:choice-of-anchor D domain-containing protein [Rhodanobacteraceae bacterium]